MSDGNPPVRIPRAFPRELAKFGESLLSGSGAKVRFGPLLANGRAIGTESERSVEGGDGGLDLIAGETALAEIAPALEILRVRTDDLLVKAGSFRHVATPLEQHCPQTQRFGARQLGLIEQSGGFIELVEADQDADELNSR